jgi:hypothetical protein
MPAMARHRFRFVSAALAAYKTLPASNTSSLPTAVLLPCTHFVSGLAAGEVTDHDLRVSLLGSRDADGYALVHLALCTVQRSSQSNLALLCRAVLPLPDDTIVAAVSVKGSAFLAWVQQVLSVPPFFLQSAQVAIGRDLKKEFECQVNRLQVKAAARTADVCSSAVPFVCESADREPDIRSDGGVSARHNCDTVEVRSIARHPGQHDGGKGLSKSA